MTIKVLNKPSPKLLTTWYAQQVVRGNITANEYVRKECQRHLNYLKNDNHRWEFDEEKGHKPIRFIEKFCKPSKGEYGQLILQPWQHFIIGSLFGWVDKETRLRRFKEGVVFVGRKNGKTTLISGLTTYGASEDGEPGADVVLLANGMKQARLLFDESTKMIKASPKLNKNFRPRRDAIYYDKTNSKIEPQAADSEKLDGLNTHIGVFDEIHEYKDYKLISVIKNSRQSRKQPLLVYITTAGYQ
ncbi:terminase large subunit, partial [Staphylococcus xylosus]